MLADLMPLILSVLCAIWRFALAEVCSNGRLHLENSRHDIVFWLPVFNSNCMIFVSLDSLLDSFKGGIFVHSSGHCTVMSSEVWIILNVSALNTERTFRFVNHIMQCKKSALISCTLLCSTLSIVNEYCCRVLLGEGYDDRYDISNLFAHGCTT